MVFAIANNRGYYRSDIFLPSAPTKRYVLEEYSSRTRGTPQYNPLHDTFRPITPEYFNPSFQERRTGIYDRPSAHYFDNQHYTSSYNSNAGKQFMI
jgi:hypothetical protein